MVEIIPITPVNPIIRSRRIVRDDEHDKQKNQNPHQNKPDDTGQSDDVVQHIDEIV